MSMYHTPTVHSHQRTHIVHTHTHTVFRVRFEQPNYTVSEFTGTNEFCIISEPASFEVYADVTTNLTVSAVNGTATSMLML